MSLLVLRKEWQKGNSECIVPFSKRGGEGREKRHVTELCGTVTRKRHGSSADCNVLGTGKFSQYCLPSIWFYVL